MISRLEQAIACGVLPESIDVYTEIAFFSIDVVDKRYWLGYTADDSAITGPHKNYIKIYFETLDEAVDALIPVLWAEIKGIEDRELYEKYCLDLIYEPMVRPASLALEIKELGISIQTELCEDWPEKYEQQLKALRIQKIKELCANGDRVPLPMPFDAVKY
jgi:hypothetical protein